MKTRLAHWTTALFAVAMLTAPLVAEARRIHAGPQVAKGRTTAIRTAIAARVNAKNLMHVGNRIKPSQIRFRSRPVKGIALHEAMGIHTRNVSWRVVRPGQGTVLGGKTRSFTPVQRSGGKWTIVEKLNLTLVPRGAPPVIQHAPQTR